MKGKSEWKKGTQFVAVIALVTIVFYFGIVLNVIGVQPFEQFTAYSASLALNALGQHTTVYAGFEPVQVLVGESHIELSELCTGMLETILLAVAIFATFEISRKKRTIGIVVGVIAAQAFNVLRVIGSVMNIVSTNQGFAELTHDVLFRISLLIVIAGFYYIWLRWALK
ncbi:MAG: exosortase/archaeosortase family protein [Candidatus Diapherotrites archaeon]